MTRQPWQAARTYRLTLTRKQWDDAYLAVRRWSSPFVANRIYRDLTADDAPHRPQTRMTRECSAYHLACILESVADDSLIAHAVRAVDVRD